VAGALLGLGFNYHQILMLVAIAAGLMFLATIPIRYPPVEMAAAVSGGPGEALRLLFGSRLIIALAIICMISTIGESVANTWAVIYLIQLGASSVIGGAAFALFNGTMFVGRLTNAALVARLGERISLIGSGVCMLLAGIILITSTSVLPAIIAFALLGIAVAGAIPTVLSATARIAPGQSGAVTGAIMSVAYLSFIICPPLIGWAAELVTLRWTLLIVAITGAIQIALGRTTPRTNS
jgi:MFS family permease